MNVLISANKWRLRLETGDLDKLLATGQLLSTLSIPGIVPLEFGIVLEDSEPLPSVSGHAPHTPSVSLKSSGLVAKISRAAAEHLLQEKPSKSAGLRHTVETSAGQCVTLIIEQDLFKQRNRESSATANVSRKESSFRMEDEP